MQLLQHCLRRAEDVTSTAVLLNRPRAPYPVAPSSILAPLPCSPPPQVARQQGEYLAALFSKNKLSLVEPGPHRSEASNNDLVPLPKPAKPFR